MKCLNILDIIMETVYKTTSVVDCENLSSELRVAETAAAVECWGF